MLAGLTEVIVDPVANTPYIGPDDISAFAIHLSHSVTFGVCRAADAGYSDHHHGPPHGSSRDQHFHRPVDACGAGSGAADIKDLRGIPGGRRYAHETSACGRLPEFLVPGSGHLEPGDDHHFGHA